MPLGRSGGAIPVHYPRANSPAIERGDSGRRAKTMIDELPLFAAAAPATPKKTPSEIEARLKALNVDALSPREALQLLYELRALTAD